MSSLHRLSSENPNQALPRSG